MHTISATFWKNAFSSFPFAAFAERKELRLRSSRQSAWNYEDNGFWLLMMILGFWAHVPNIQTTWIVKFSTSLSRFNCFFDYTIKQFVLYHWLELVRFYGLGQKRISIQFNAIIRYYACLFKFRTFFIVVWRSNGTFRDFGYSIVSNRDNTITLRIVSFVYSRFQSVAKVDIFFGFYECIGKTIFGYFN